MEELFCELFQSCQWSSILKRDGYVFTVGLFDQDEAIQQMFELSVEAVNKYKYEDQELSNVFFTSETEKIEVDLFEVSSKGEAASQC